MKYLWLDVKQSTINQSEFLVINVTVT